MTLVPSDESKYALKKCKELWNKMANLIRSITNNSDDCNEKYVKIKYQNTWCLHSFIQLSLNSGSA